MSKKVSHKKHAAKIKFQIVVESLSREGKLIDIARQYGINPNLITKWRKEFFERGCQIFEQGSPAQEAERKIGDLQRIIGKKEVEIELLKNFLGNLSSR